MSNWNYPDDLLEAAWGLIANAKDWDLEDRDAWIDAAKEWREAYFATLPTMEEPQTK